uniref:Uncharacterized protein n=1 Tax=Arundo donax TaxID=35708 RepID=A0A0A9AQC7_ARUDO
MELKVCLNQMATYMLRPMVV